MKGTLALIGAVVVGGLIGFIGQPYVKNSRVAELQGELTTANEALEDTRGQLSEASAARDQALDDLRIKDGQLQEAHVRNSELTEENRELERERDQLAYRMQFLETDRPLARAEVVAQRTEERIGDDGTPKLVLVSDIVLTPVNLEGVPIAEAQREFSVEGETFYLEVDAIKFKDGLIPDVRSGAVFLLKRAFGDEQAPNRGAVLDQEGSLPTLYTLPGESDPEIEEIWDNFWEIARDQQELDSRNIRVLQREAVGQNVLAPPAGKESAVGLELELRSRANGELSLIPILDYPVRID